MTNSNYSDLSLSFRSPHNIVKLTDLLDKVSDYIETEGTPRVRIDLEQIADKSIFEGSYGVIGYAKSINKNNSKLNICINNRFKHLFKDGAYVTAVVTGTIDKYIDTRGIKNIKIEKLVIGGIHI